MKFLVLVSLIMIPTHSWSTTVTVPNTFAATTVISATQMNANFGALTTFLTNLSAADITAGTLGVSRGGTGASSLSANGFVYVNVGGTALSSSPCSNGQFPFFNSGWVCSTLQSEGAIIMDGNSNGSPLTIGTNDTNPLKLEVQGSEIMHFGTDQKVGILTPSPQGAFDINSSISGIVIPRLSNTTILSGLSSAANGMMVYDSTNNNFMVRQNGAWVPMTTPQKKAFAAGLTNTPSLDAVTCYSNPVSTGTEFVAPGHSEEFDPYLLFDHAGTRRFTAPATGLYEIFLDIPASDATKQGKVHSVLKINGSTDYVAQTSRNFHTILRLTVNDFVELFVTCKDPGLTDSDIDLEHALSVYTIKKYEP